MATLSTNMNYLQPTGFRVVMDRKHLPNLNYFANSASHPNLNAAETLLPYQRVNLRVATDKLTFGELQLNIIMDENMSAYEEMYNWMKALVEVNNTPNKDRTDTVRPTTADVSLIPLTSNNNQTKIIKYLNCVPTSLGTIEFVTTNADEFITFPVSFAFSYFELV